MENFYEEYIYTDLEAQMRFEEEFNGSVSMFTELTHLITHTENTSFLPKFYSRAQLTVFATFSRLFKSFQSLKGMYFLLFNEIIIEKGKRL